MVRTHARSFQGYSGFKEDWTWWASQRNKQSHAHWRGVVCYLIHGDYLQFFPTGPDRYFRDRVFAYAARCRRVDATCRCPRACICIRNDCACIVPAAEEVRHFPDTRRRVASVRPHRKSVPVRYGHNAPSLAGGNSGRLAVSGQSGQGSCTSAAYQQQQKSVAAERIELKPGSIPFVRPNDGATRSCIGDLQRGRRHTCAKAH